MRIKTTLLAACAVALIAPAASQAATLGMDGNTLVYKGEGSEGISLLLSSYEDWNTGTEYLRFSDSGADRVLIQTDVCQNHQYGGIICERDPNRPIRIEGSDAKDEKSAAAEVRTSASGQAPSQDTVELVPVKDGWRVSTLGDG